MPASALRPVQRGTVPSTRQSMAVGMGMAAAYLVGWRCSSLEGGWLIGAGLWIILATVVGAALHWLRD